MTSDICSNEADFGEIKDLPVQAMPREGAAASRRGAKPPPYSVPALALPIETR
jgi:hypothetical protein